MAENVELSSKRTFGIGDFNIASAQAGDMIEVAKQALVDDAVRYIGYQMRVICGLDEPYDRFTRRTSGQIDARSDDFVPISKSVSIGASDIISKPRLYVVAPPRKHPANRIWFRDRPPETEDLEFFRTARARMAYVVTVEDEHNKKEVGRIFDYSAQLSKVLVRKSVTSFEVPTDNLSSRLARAAGSIHTSGQIVAPNQALIDYVQAHIDLEPKQVDSSFHN